MTLNNVPSFTLAPVIKFSLNKNRDLNNHMIKTPGRENTYGPKLRNFLRKLENISLNQFSGDIKYALFTGDQNMKLNVMI